MLRPRPSSKAAGFAGSRLARPKAIGVFVFTTALFVIAGMRPGASGYLAKDQPAEEIVAAIRAVNEGQSLFRTSGAARALPLLLESAPASAPARTEAPHPAAEHLIGWETEVLRLIDDGLANREIADRLVISEATVKTHVNNIFAKLWNGDEPRPVSIRQFLLSHPERYRL